MKAPKNYYNTVDQQKLGLDQIDKNKKAIEELQDLPVLPTPGEGDEGKVPKVNSSGEYELTSDEGLPHVTSSDEGKVLTVDNQGAWGAATIPSQLPAVTSSDEGKVLAVDSNGVWIAANFSGGNAEVALTNYFRVTGGNDAFVNLSDLILSATHKVKVVFNTINAGVDNAVIFCTNRGGWDARNSLNVRLYQGKYIVGATVTDIAYSAGDHTVEFNLSNGEMKFDGNIIAATFDTQWTIYNCIRIGKMDGLGINAAAYIKSVQILDQSDDVLYDCKPAILTIDSTNNAYYMHDEVHHKLYGGSGISESIDSIPT